jgi:23S rRNA (adenine2503-C2)-methyltransferase
VPATNLFDHNFSTLRELLVSFNEKPFRATQILKWIHQLGVTDFDKMTNLSLSMRNWLKENAVIEMPQPIRELVSTDGTKKWLLQLHDNNCIEMVYIPEDDRGTLCVSTQVGCPMGCAFCATGSLGFTRNLTVGEIISQLWWATKFLSDESFAKPHIVTNVVLMGMGEPLLNFDNVIKATELMLSDLTYNLSKYRVTLSTAGLVPEMKKLKEISEISLAVSLHAPNDELRNKLIPINKKYPLAQLMKVCQNYFEDWRRVVTIEYIMIDGVNDTFDHAKQLVELLRDVPCKVNLIPANSFPGGSFHSSTDDAIEKFRKVLLQAGMNVITRKKRGADIAAACGQLVAAGL